LPANRDVVNAPDRESRPNLPVSSALSVKTTLTSLKITFRSLNFTLRSLIFREPSLKITLVRVILTRHPPFFVGVSAILTLYSTIFGDAPMKFRLRSLKIRE
jgi:hypothetical protein